MRKIDVLRVRLPARSGLWRLGWPTLGFDSESLRILGVQARPTKFHRFATDDTPDGIIGKEPLEHIEADVPARCTHRYETTIDVVPERKARAVAEGLELPSD